MSENNRRKGGPLDIPVIAIVASIFVIFLLFIGTVIGGTIFLWGWEPHDGDEIDPGTIEAEGRIYYSETEQGGICTFTIVVLSDIVDWSNFQVRIDGDYLPLHDEVDEEGDNETFTWTVSESNVGDTVEVMIVNVERNSVAWEKDIMVLRKQTEGYVDVICISAWITWNASEEGSENTMIFEILSGSVDWKRYEVRADGIVLDRSTDVDLAGDTESFSWARNESNVGQMIDVKIISLDDDNVVWMNDIIIRSA